MVVRFAEPCIERVFLISRFVAGVSTVRGLGYIVQVEDVGVEVDVDKGVAVDRDISIETLQCGQFDDEAPLVPLEVGWILVGHLTVFDSPLRHGEVCLVGADPGRDFVSAALETVSSSYLDEQVGLVVAYLECASISELVACVEDLLDAMVCIIRNCIDIDCVLI